MNIAQRLFIVTSWMFIILSGLLFLVPASVPSIEAAAWTCLAVGVLSHLALLVAIIYDQLPAPLENPSTE